VVKTASGATTHYLGNDAELSVSAVAPAGLWTSYLHPDVKREGTVLSFLHKDSLGSIRRVSQASGTAATHDYGPYGQP
jgi:hypothetical protein